MPLTSLFGGQLRARNIDGPGGGSQTVQLPTVDAFCEIALFTVLTQEDEDGASDAWISQIVSASGVENFSLIGAVVPLFRKRVTTVTFSIWVFNNEARARWQVFVWS